MNYDRIESKLGFDKIREIIASRCATDYAAERTAAEAFSTEAREIRSRLALTEEMRLILLFEDNFPSSGYIDALPFLKALENPSVSLDILSLGKLGTLLDTVRRLRAFFTSAGDGVYPLLKKRAVKVPYYPEVLRRIESILDRHGDIKDSASPALAQIRARIREKEQGLSRRAEAVLRRAQAEGLCEADPCATAACSSRSTPPSSASCPALSSANPPPARPVSSSRLRSWNSKTKSANCATTRPGRFPPFCAHSAILPVPMRRNCRKARFSSARRIS